MKLLRFRIKNYKSILDSGWCEPSGDNITVLAGQNEVGKTNVLKALRDFDYEGKIEQEAIPDNEDDDKKPEILCEFSFNEEDLKLVMKDALYKDLSFQPNELLENVRKIGKLNISKTYRHGFSLEDSLIDNLKQMIEKFQEVQVIKTEIKNENQPMAVTPATPPQTTETTSKKIKINVEEVQKNLATIFVKIGPFFVYYDNFDFVLPSKKYIANIENKKELGYQPVQDFLKISKLDTKKLIELKDDKLVDNYCDKCSKRITDNYLRYWADKHSEYKNIELIVKYGKDEKGDYLTFYVKDQDSKKYPEQRSKGFLWFLSFYLRINAVRDANEILGSIILIDEPGSYLHSKSQNNVLKFLEEEVAKNNQIIFSTHSSDLIDPNRLNRVRLVSNAPKEKTKISTIAAGNSAQLDMSYHDALTPIVMAIGMDLNKRLDLVGKKNVIVEGISDYFYFTTFRDKNDFKVSEEIKFIPMRGVFTVSTMVSLMIGWGLNYLVILDREGNANEEYRKLTEELAVDPARIMQLDGCPGIEDMFTKDDFYKYVLKKQLDSTSKLANSKIIDSNDKVIKAKEFLSEYSREFPKLEAATAEKYKSVFDFIRKGF